MHQTELHYQLLQAIKANPNASQRQLAKEVGISLGKANYCLKSLIEKGWVKAGNFKRSKNKLGYLYLLTPEGVEEKAKLTQSFLERKVAEYEQLENEIEQLRQQVSAHNKSN